MNYFKTLKTKQLIKGYNADYSPKYYFVWKGRIYAKLKDDTAYERGFKYPCVDILKG